MRKQLLPVAALGAVVSALALGLLDGSDANAHPSANVSVQLLAINDFHGNIEPPSGSSGRIGTTDAGGVEYLATHLKTLAATNANSIFVGAGDLIGASPLISALFHDEPTIESMNEMGLAVTSVGNHEFDEGWTELLRMQKGGCHPQDGCQDGDPFTGAKFQYLSANVIKRPTDAEKAAYTKARGNYLKARANYQKALSAYKKKLNAKKAACKKNAKSRACKAKVRAPKKFTAKAPKAPVAAPLLPATYVKTIGGVKIGFIGETLEGTPTIVTPTGVAGLTFLDEAETANKYAAELEKQGVKAIVLLIHEGGAQTGSSPGAPNTCTGLSGPIIDIVNRLGPSIDVVLSAHTHNAYNCTINGKLVTSAASFGRLITDVDLDVDSATGEVVNKTATNVTVTRTVAKDPALTTLVTKYKNLSAAQAGKVVGSVTADITRAANAAGESALGDVIADAQLESTKDATKGSAVVALMNPGGIRAEITAAQVSSGEQPGQVTYGELFTVQPFSNVMTVKTCTGDQIKRILEQQFDNPSIGADRVLQVPNGFTYSYNRSAAAGSRVDASSIKIGGTAVVATQSYRVAMNNFLAEGGDNFTVFKECTNPLGGEIDLDALVAYFKAHSPIAPGPRDRIVRTG